MTSNKEVDALNLPALRNMAQRLGLSREGTQASLQKRVKAHLTVLRKPAAEAIILPQAEAAVPLVAAEDNVQPEAGIATEGETAAPDEEEEEGEVVLIRETQPTRTRVRREAAPSLAGLAEAIISLTQAKTEQTRRWKKRSRDSSDDDDDNGDDDENGRHPWKATLKMRVPEVRLRRTWLRWDLAYVHLSPIMWVVLEWEAPLAIEEWEGRLGTHGPHLLALRCLWKEAWAISENEALQLGTSLLSLITLVRMRPRDLTPDGWCRLFFIPHVLPLLRSTRLHQAAKYRSAGRSDLAQRMTILAEGGSNALGADVEHVAEKAMSKVQSGASNPKIQDSNRVVRPNKGIWCKVCHAHFDAKGEKRPEAYARHNAEKKHPAA